MKDKIEQIRKACIKANPEIVELKFGCDYKTKDDIFSIIFRIRRLDKTGTKAEISIGNLLTEVETKLVTDKVIDKVKEIIGRPIRLADVLVAMEHTTVRNDGAIFTNNEQRPVRWNLKDNNLENQSKETIDFIHGFLK